MTFQPAYGRRGSVLSLFRAFPSAVFFRIFSILSASASVVLRTYRRIAYQQHMIGDDGILCHQCATPMIQSLPIFAPFSTIAPYRSVYCLRSYSHESLLHDRWLHNLRSVPEILRPHVPLTVILNIGVCPNTYLLSVCSDSGMVPDTAARSDLHIARANGPFCDINIVRFLQFFPVLHFFSLFFSFFF